MQHSFPSEITRLITFFTIVLVAAAVLVTFFVPIVFSSTNPTDSYSYSLLEVAWQIYHGFLPGMHFRHFFGGMTEQVIARAIEIAGLDANALDRAIVLYWVLLVAATAAVLILARMLRGRGAGAKLLGGGAVTGVAIAAVALTKPTFAVVVPRALLALVMQGRCGGWLASLAVFAMVFARYRTRRARHRLWARDDHGTDALRRNLGIDRNPLHIDAAFSIGFLHHLKHDSVTHLIRRLLDCLRPGGTAYFLAPVRLELQPLIAFALKERDSGQHLHEAAAYLERPGTRLETQITHDLKRVRYDHFWDCVTWN